VHLVHAFHLLLHFALHVLHIVGHVLSEGIREEVVVHWWFDGARMLRLGLGSWLSDQEHVGSVGVHLVALWVLVEGLVAISVDGHHDGHYLWCILLWIIAREELLTSVAPRLLKAHHRATWVT